MEISLTDWVDFVIAAGPPQLTKVRQLAARGEYDPRCDFWKQLREAIQNYHQGVGGLDEATKALKDPKKLARYPAALQSYKKFLGRKHLAWFRPPSATWSFGELSVRVNPELGLQLDGKKHIIKLYFKGDRPTKLRLNIVFAMMRIALPIAHEFVPAVLDVSASRLIIPGHKEEDLLPLMQAQAISFIHMWNSVRKPLTLAAKALA